MVFRNIHMTRVFPAKRLLQTSNGWQEPFHSAHVPHKNLINDGSKFATNTVSITCQKIQDFHPIGIFTGDNPLAYTFSLLMFNLILVTTITRIVRILLKPFKQPKVVSQIIVSFFFSSYCYLEKCRS